MWVCCAIVLGCMQVLEIRSLDTIIASSTRTGRTPCVCVVQLRRIYGVGAAGRSFCHRLTVVSILSDLLACLSASFCCVVVSCILLLSINQQVDHLLALTALKVWVQTEGVALGLRQHCCTARQPQISHLAAN